MYPRLKLAQKLLTGDGVIFVRIDDNEQANLKLLMDDIFGEGNFVAELIWKSKSGGANDSNFFAIDHEYIVCYAKNANDFNLQSDKNAEVTTIYNLEDENGKYSLDRLDKQSLGYLPSLDFPIKSPDGTLYRVEHKNPNNKVARWRWGEETVKERFNELVFKDRYVYTKNYQKERAIPRSLLIEERFGRTRTGKTDLTDLFEIKNIFDNPKPLKLITHLISISTDDIILDFFAGSGTTAQAALELNSEDGGNRKFILVQLDEPTNPASEARKAGYETIDEIARERIKRAAQKIKTEAGLSAQHLDCGFKHFRLISPDVKTVNKIIEFDPNKSLFDDNMITPFAYPKTDTSGLDTLLATWLIDDGFSFYTPIETVTFASYQAYYVKDAAMLYLIDQNWNTEALKSLLNKIGKNELCVNTIVIYPYSFSFEDMRELKTNIKTNLDNSPTIIERY
jgi:adenine-specific DNA-methyltransferase